MEKYQISRGSRRPDSCGMPNSVPYMMQSSRTGSPSSVSGNCNSDNSKNCPSANPQKNFSDISKHLEHLPLAIAYVPLQKFTAVYDTCYALKVGTIFPDLCKPFCGKRGVMR